MRFPTLAEAVLLTVAALVVSVIVSVPFAVLQIVQGRSGFAMHPVMAAVVNTLAVGGVALYGARKTGLPIGEAFQLRRFDLRLLVPAAVLITGLNILLSELDNIMRLAIPASPEFVEMMKQTLGGERSVVWSFILAAIVAPITEESLFRGVILGGLLTRFSKWRAILITATLFGSLHMNPWQLLGATVFGIVAGWMVSETGSLWISLWAHAVGNVMVTAIPHLPWKIPGFNTDPLGPVEFQPLWMNMTGALMFIIGLLVFQWLRLRASADGAHSPSTPSAE